MASAKDPEVASGLLSSMESECDAKNPPPEAGTGPRRVFMASGALTLSFACGALAVAFFLRSEPKTEAVMASMPNADMDDAHRWMEDPGVVEMPTKRDLGELLKAIQAHYPDGGVFEHVKYLDIDGKDPDNLKYDYNMKVFKNATKGPVKRMLQDADVDDVGKIDVVRQMLWALCGIDAAQIISSIGQIVTNIRTVTQACKNPYPWDANQQDFCAAMVSLNLAIWGYIAIYIEDMVSVCGPTFNVQAGCSIDITGFLANAALVAAAGANMKSNCLPKHGYWSERLDGVFPKITTNTKLEGVRAFSGVSQSVLDKVNKEIRETKMARIRVNDRMRSESSVGRGFRRLAEVTADLATLPADPAASAEAHAREEVGSIQEGAMSALSHVAEAASDDNKEFVDEKAKEAADRLGLDYETYHDLHKKDTERTWKKVQCGFDLSKAVARFAQMGTLIALSTKDCGAHNFEVNGHQGKTKCTIDVTGAIASAGIASSMITLSVINCPGALDYTRAMSERLCAASIIDLVSAATYIGTSIASVQSTCGSLDHYPGVPGT